MKEENKQTNKQIFNQTDIMHTHSSSCLVSLGFFAICKKERERAKHATNNNKIHTHKTKSERERAKKRVKKQTKEMRKEPSECLGGFSLISILHLSTSRFKVRFPEQQKI